MRWFYAALVIAVLAAADRAYMRGQNTELVMSGLRYGAAIITRHVDDVLAYFRR